MPPEHAARTYLLLDADGRTYRCETAGRWGGHRRGKIYGRLDCRAALRAIAAGGYVKYRVFFADEATAIAAGYRPCAVCCPERYRTWKETHDARNPPPAQHNPHRPRRSGHH